MCTEPLLTQHASSPRLSELYGAEMLDGDVRDLVLSDTYIRGWKELSSSSRCKGKQDCGCYLTGCCETEWFYVFYAQIGSEACEAPVHKLSLHLFVDTMACEVSMEEIPVCPATLGSAYSYFKTYALPMGDTWTLASVYMGGQLKSSCFDLIDCVIAKVPAAHVTESMCVVQGESSGMSQILLVRVEQVVTIAECLRSVGINPILANAAVITVHADSTSLKYVSGISVASRACVLATIQDSDWKDASTDYPVRAQMNVSAVATAAVTISVAMTQRPLHDGSYSTRKLVRLIVHNVK